MGVAWVPCWPREPWTLRRGDHLHRLGRPLLVSLIPRPALTVAGAVPVLGIPGAGHWTEGGGGGTVSGDSAVLHGSPSNTMARARVKVGFKNYAVV